MKDQVQNYIKLARKILEVADNCRRVALAKKIEEAAIGLLGDLVVGDDRISQNLSLLEAFLNLIDSRGAEEKNALNSILQEIRQFNSAIRQSPLPNYDEFGNESSLGAEDHQKNVDFPTEFELSEFGNDYFEDLGQDLNSEVRQRAILAKIKELASKKEECSLKNLKASFPDVSDRTLRYDLQKLTQRGDIVRTGNRGPNTVYNVINSQLPRYNS